MIWTPGQKLSNFFVGILVQMMTPIGHFEIIWPLTKKSKWFCSPGSVPDTKKYYFWKFQRGAIINPFYRKRKSQSARNWPIQLIKFSIEILNNKFMYEYDLSSEKYRFVPSSKMSNWTEEDWKPQNVITLWLVSCRLLISMTTILEHSETKLVRSHL